MRSRWTAPFGLPGIAGLPDIAVVHLHRFAHRLPGFARRLASLFRLTAGFAVGMIPVSMCLVHKLFTAFQLQITHRREGEQPNVSLLSTVLETLWGSWHNQQLRDRAVQLRAR